MMVMQGLPNSACPSASALQEYAADCPDGAGATDVARHLAQCPTCADIARGLRGVGDGASGDIIPPAPSQAALDEARRISTHGAERFRGLIGQQRPERIRFGQFWTTLRAAQWQHEADDDTQLRIVVTIADQPPAPAVSEAVLTVAPVSPAVAFRSCDDLLVRAMEGPLGHDVMIEAWNTVAMLPTQLGRYLGILPQPLKRYLGLICQAQLGLTVDLAPLAGRLGPAIREAADPRVHFQQLEIAACAYLREPALRVDEAPAAAMAPAAQEIPAAPAVEQRPFAGILVEGKARGLSLRQLADRLGLTPALVRKLDLRTFRVASLEGGVIRAIADAFGWDQSALSRYLHGSQTLASGAAYRADQAPETTGQEDFFEAVRTDPQMTEEQRARWLQLASPEA